MDLGDLWKRQLQEREFQDRNTEAAVDHARTAAFERYRPQWRELYRAHKKEMKHLHKNATHPFERAVFVFSQRERLGNGRPLTFRQMVQLIIKPEQLVKRVETVQQKERRSLASAEKSDKRVITKRLWEQHKTKFDVMRARQQQERVAARSEHETQLRSIVTFDLAKESLLAERRAAKTIEPQAEPTQTVAETFNTSVTTRTPTQMARVEAIKKQMEEWRKRNPGRDFGHEM